MKIIEIAVASGKGGVGKSTVSSSIALKLFEKGVKVIAVDADADAPNLHLVLGVREWEWVKPYSETYVVEIVEEKCIKCGECMKVCPYMAIHVDERGLFYVNQVICEGCLTCSLVCPVKGAIIRKQVQTGFIRKTKTPYGFPLISASLNPGRPNSGKLVTEEKSLAREMADEETIIVVDSAAGIGCQVVSSLAGAHMAILVAEPTPASLQAIKRVYKLTRHFMQPSALVVNKYDINENYWRKLMDFSEKNHIYYLGEIPYDEAIPNSMVQMKPVLKAFPNSKASKALEKISEEVYLIVENWKEWFRKYRPRKPEPYKPIILKPSSMGKS